MTLPRSTAIDVVISESATGQRLDRALADAPELKPFELSRSRVAALIDEGAVTSDQVASRRNKKVAMGERYRIEIPAVVDATPLPEEIALDIVHEDADLIVVNKPAGMVVHPAPGAESGTLVNALLAHCGDSLSGVGGVRRPGIVHRIDKDTSGLLVVAKTDRAHGALSKNFAEHTIERRYEAVLWGVPDRANARLAGLEEVHFADAGWLRIGSEIGRHPTDRKRMAVVKAGGRHAVTHLRVEERFGNGGALVASRVICQLETGRTHQIRVHAHHIGHGLIGDPVYGRAKAITKSAIDEVAKTALGAFSRQALHAARLGFEHPVSGETLRFESELPKDMHDLLRSLRRNS